MDEVVPSPYPPPEPPRARPRIVADTTPRQPITVVLGMHRSGTSLCSHVLSLLGVDMADTAFPLGSDTPGSDNARGHWERWEIVGFHDRILAQFNRTYAKSFHDLPLAPGWWADPRIGAIRREMVEFVRPRLGLMPFGFKDPRTVRLLPIWRQIFAELKLSPKIVLCLRNPAAVARSLQARDGLDPRIGEYRWLVHIVDFFRYIGNAEYCTIEYETWFADYRTNAHRLREFCDLDWQQNQSDLDDALAEVIDPLLRHDNDAQQEASDPFVRRFYRVAAAAGHDGAARRQAQELTAQFVGFERLRRPLDRTQETAAAIAARVPGLEQEMAGLQTALAEGTTALDTARQQTEAVNAALAQARAESEAQQARLAESETEREAAAARADTAETALAQAQAALEAERAAVAAAQSSLAEAAAAAEAAQLRSEAAEAGLAEMSSALAAAEAESAAARQAALADKAAALAAAEAEIAAQRARLAASAAEAAQAGQRREALQGEIATLRDRLAASGEEVRSRDARTAALQEEMARLRDEVAASRQVGRAMVAAFRADPSLPPEPDGRPGWWRRVLRRAGLAPRIAL